MAVADVPFDLVQVKLAAPQTRPGTTAKRDVIERLCQSQEARVSVVAPAGYGKTTLLGT
jgi:ATP/maltotriose-dependent transcriptional regulator MalT